MGKKMRVWWIPQVPMEPFLIEVQCWRDALMILRAFADYDNFQVTHGIKPDCTNGGGLEVYDENDGEWSEWYDENGFDIDDYIDGVVTA